ncbi:hypothetical protein [Streptomyces afghaniensis]|uniref:hypothetical protein n=1 Tax=Streptomyces afghaniensis TaxID=66865 RepID=UPI0037B4A4B8
MNIVTTGDLAIRSFKSCVVFDTSDGRILHIHDVVTIEGGEDTSDEAVARQALQLAAERGVDTRNLDTLHLDPETLESGTAFRVDLQARSLVALDKTPE